MSRLFLAACLAVASAAPILDNFLAETCTGTGNPAETSQGHGICYKGGLEILGGTWKETVLVHIKEFDTASGKGFLKLDAEGASPQHCEKKPFTKPPSSSDIELNFGGCLSGATVTAKYCSDQDTLLIHVSVPNKHVPTVPVTLRKTECPKGKGNGIGPNSSKLKRLA